MTKALRNHILRATAMLCTVFLLNFPNQAEACDTSPVISASNVTAIGGGNYTVDFQVCMGINGSEDGFDLQVGCGLSILNATPLTLSGAGGNANASIVGNTVTYDCPTCNPGNWWELDDGIAGPCHNFTLTVDGNPENCQYTVSGVNDGCLIIQTSWTNTIPGPCVVDFSGTAPNTHSSTTAGQGNECNLRTSVDRVYEVNLPCNDTWTFSLCGGSTWDTYLYLGTNCCTQDLGLNDDACGLQSEITANAGPGTVYVTIEAFSTGSGTYTLNITNSAGCPLNFSDQIELTAVPNASETAVALEFEVQDEQNVMEYYIERSTDGSTYLPLQQFEPKGAGPGGLTTYQHLDQTVKKDQPYFYRIHVHTMDGQMFETAPVVVTLGAPKGLAVGSISPNPASDETRILLVSDQETMVTASIFDMRGAMVDRQMIPAHAGASESRLDLRKLNSGVYFVRIQGDDGSAITRKLVVEQ